MSELRRRAAGPILIAGLLAVAGCVAPLEGPRFEEPTLELPDVFGPPLEDDGATPPGVGGVAWEEFFADPDLAALIELALENNRELDLQVQEILIANAAVLARSGAYLPFVDAGAGVGVEKVGRLTSQGASDEADGVPEDLRLHSLGFAASWEVDLWGRLRGAARAERLRALATVEGRNLLVTRLVAEIAASYYELMALDRRLEVLRSNIELQRTALEIVRLEKRAARVTELAVQRFEAEVLMNRSRVYDLEQAIVETENRLNLLVGRFPEPIPRDPSRLDADLPARLASGVPAELLANRPDVRRAELRLRAAAIDVDVARADFYPRLELEAGLGLESWRSGELFEFPESAFYGLSGRLLAPLFNRRALRAEYITADAERSRAVLEYEQTLLEAYAEVSTQLALVDNLARSYALESEQVALLSRAIDVSTTLFQSARADYMEVLLTRRDALEAQMELVETRLRQRRALIHVYQALGGGWRGAGVAPDLAPSARDDRAEPDAE